MSVSTLSSFKLAWVQAFIAVVQFGSESAAAREIKCDQSTISRHLKQLGIFLGGDLFEGDSSSRLTPLGTAFCTKAEELMDWARDCRKLNDKSTTTEPAIRPASAPKAKVRPLLKWLGLKSSKWLFPE